MTAGTMEAWPCEGLTCRVERAEGSSRGQRWPIPGVREITVVRDETEIMMIADIRTDLPPTTSFAMDSHRAIGELSFGNELANSFLDCFRWLWTL